MSKNLVIVESPTKARTLQRFLGNEYAVEASVDLHAKSADLMSSEVGEVGLTPSDVIEGLRILLRYD